MPTPKYYLLDENKNLIEGFDKEGFLGLLEQAIEQGTLENIDEDSAVASKLRSALNGSTHHIEFLTQAQYNQLVADEELVANTYYFITDDTTLEGLEEQINEIIEVMESLEDNVSDFKWKRKASGATSYDLEYGKQYFIRVKDGGYAYPSFDNTKKYYGSFTIEQRTILKSYHLVQQGIAQPVTSGYQYEFFVGGARVYEDNTETQTILAIQDANQTKSLTLNCSTTMDIYEMK